MAKRVVYYRNFRKKFIKKIESDIPAGTPIEIDEKLDPGFFEFDNNYWNVYVNGSLQAAGADKDFTMDENLSVIFNFDVIQNDIVAVSIVY